MKEINSQTKKEYQQIVEQISQPKVANDIPKLQELSRKKAKLERIILDYKKLQKVEE